MVCHGDKERESFKQREPKELVVARRRGFAGRVGGCGGSPEKMVVNVAVIKSSKDTRYGLNSIVTHDGEKLPCWPLAALSSFKERIGHEAYHKLEVIGIDEAQFFDDLYDFCVKAADHDGKTVIVAGLDGDYLRRSFGVVDLVPIAESVTKLKARCELCGKPAAFTLRKTEETEREVVN